MLEMETVGVFGRLKPGESSELSESWQLFGNVPEIKTEEDVDKQILPLLRR